MGCVKITFRAIVVELAIRVGLHIGFVGLGSHANRLLRCLDWSLVERMSYFRGEITEPMSLPQDLSAEKCAALRDLKTCDAILVCSPDDTHKQVVSEIGNWFDGYLFIEKPFFERVSTGLDDSLWKRVMVNYPLRYSFLNSTLDSLMSIDQLVMFRSFGSNQLALKIRDGSACWRARKFHSVLSKLIHQVDFVVSKLGPSSEIGRNLKLTENDAYLNCLWSGDVAVSLSASYRVPLQHYYELFFENHYVRIDRYEYFIKRSDFLYSRIGESSDHQSPQSGTFPNGVAFWDHALKGSLDFFFDHLVHRKEFDLHILDQHFVAERECGLS